METTAIFLEPKIRTYAFQLETDLSLFEVKVGPDAGDQGAVIEALGDMGIPFRLVLGQIQDNRFLSLSIVVHEDCQSRLMDNLNRIPGISAEDDCLPPSAVELLFFQGPHYGDRPGIAHAVLDSLRSKGIEAAAMAFSVSCVYLVFETGLGKKARDILMEDFEIPVKKGRRGTKKNNDI